MNLLYIYTVRFLFLVIRMENVTSVWKTKYVLVYVLLYRFRFKSQ